MFNKLIKEYVNHLEKKDINVFALKNGIELNEKEISLIYDYIKKDWKTIIYGNPRNIFIELKKSINENTFIKMNMISRIYKRTVQKFRKSHIIIIDPGDEEDCDRFFSWLYSDDLEKQPTIIKLNEY